MNPSWDLGFHGVLEKQDKEKRLLEAAILENKSKRVCVCVMLHGHGEITEVNTNASVNWDGGK